jgi:carotenoid 1,2-hydratase
LGSVFSPYYFRARARGEGDPLNFSAMNLALYGSSVWNPSARWAMTERGRTAIERDAHRLAIGPSVLDWDGTRLEIRIDERAMPLPLRVRGSIRLFPESLAESTWHLDSPGLHRWSPIAPCARIEVDFKNPALKWRGLGYLDSNQGDCPLEDSFVRWDWSRTHGSNHATSLLYDVTERSPLTGNHGLRRTIAARILRDGSSEALAVPPSRSLPPTSIWRIRRATHSVVEDLRIAQTLEDTPFYARSVLRSGSSGAVSEPTMHESLDLDRFKKAWVRALLPFRMPRLG